MSLFDALLRMGLVFGLFAACMWWLYKAQPLRARAEGRRMRVVQSMPLGRKSHLSIVTVDGRQLLVGVGEGTVTLLTELEADAVVVDTTDLQQPANSPLSAFRTVLAARLRVPAGEERS